MRIAVMLSVTVLLAGCGGGQVLDAGVKQWRGPQGADTYALTCSGVLVSMDTCVRKAQELCPKGYTTLEGGPEKAATGENKSWDLPETNRQMTIECQ